MHIITGGTGHVGTTLAELLLKKGEAVTIISRSSEKAKQWIDKGAHIAVADIYDTEALHEIFKTGKSIFILNPPADPMTDTSLQERKTIASLLNALKYSGVTKIVVESTLGAQPGENIGDLGTLYELEQGIEKLSHPYSIIRPAYYMSNWAGQLKIVQETGELTSFYPADLKIPMVAPEDIGELAAHLMTTPNTPKINSIQGPELYSASDVAEAFSKSLDKKVKLKIIPRNQWKAAYISMGFSDIAAESYTRMTAISADGDFEMPENFIKGKITLHKYIDCLVSETGKVVKLASA